MKKLLAILFLGALLYSCTENEKPDQVNLELQSLRSRVPINNNQDITQIPSQVPKGGSENAKIMASFTPIDDVSGTYTTETTLIDISKIPCESDVNLVTDGVMTLDFDKLLNKLQVDVCLWRGPFGNFPDVEGPNPHILYSKGQNSVGITLSSSASTFGLELQPNSFTDHRYKVSFFSHGILIGSITRATNLGRLFAATTDAEFNFILVEAIDPSGGFSIGQFRYTLADDKNPFIVDVKPESCENPVNVNSQGVIPVGILTSMDLDVNDIDLSTVRLNGVAPQSYYIAELGGFYEKEEACDCDPTEFDGFMDLDLKFNTKAVVAALGNVSDGEKVIVSLSFDTVDGKSWTGEDCIWIIKKGKK